VGKTSEIYLIVFGKKTEKTRLKVGRPGEVRRGGHTLGEKTGARKYTVISSSGIRNAQ